MGTFDELLEKMPSIAKAVNAFDGDETQRRALDALLSAFSGEGSPPSPKKTNPAPVDTPPRKKRKRSGGDAEDKQTTKKKLSPTPSRVTDLDFHPDGVKSFRDFLEEKKPKTNDERCVVAVYWLGEKAGRHPVTRDDVYTCYRLIDSWKVPADINNTIQSAASRKNWLDTSDMADIKLTPLGVNAVEHDLPRS